MVLLQGPARLSSKARKGPWRGCEFISKADAVYLPRNLSSVSGQMHPEGLMESLLILHPALSWGLPAGTGASEGRAGLAMGARGLGGTGQQDRGNRGNGDGGKPSGSPSSNSSPGRLLLSLIYQAQLEEPVAAPRPAGFPSGALPCPLAVPVSATRPG